MRGDYQATVDAVQLLVTKRRQLLEVDEVAYGVLLSASTKLEREARAHLTGPPEDESDAAINASHKDSRQWRVAVQACIADLPAEEL